MGKKVYINAIESFEPGDMFYCADPETLEEIEPIVHELEAMLGQGVPPDQFVWDAYRIALTKVIREAYPLDGLDWSVGRNSRGILVITIKGEQI